MRFDQQKTGLDDDFAAILLNMCSSIIENGGLEHHFPLPLVKIDALMAKTNLLIPVFVLCWSNFCRFLRLDQQKTGLDHDFAAILVKMCASIIENGGLEHHFALPLAKMHALMAKTNLLIPVFFAMLVKLLHIFAS